MSEAEHIKDALVAYLSNEMAWYSDWSDRYGFWFNGLSFAALLFSFLSALIAAGIKSKSDSDSSAPNPIYTWLLIILPALSGLCLSILSQWTLKDSWKTREAGRIATNRLLLVAKSIKTDNIEYVRTEDMRIRNLYFDIETDQANSFFSPGDGKNKLKPSDSEAKKSEKTNDNKDAIKEGVTK